jgi:hypothetical protein
MAVLVVSMESILAVYVQLARLDPDIIQRVDFVNFELGPFAAGL